MAIPEQWSGLTADAKRERLLAAAEALFAREGLAAPMPAVAAAAGAGVGSLYRQFPSKEELVAALALKRMAHVEAALDAALTLEDAAAGVELFLWQILEPYACDDLVAQAIASLSGDRIDAAKNAVTAKMERLLEAARAQGGIRPDITPLDVHLVIVGARAARSVEPDAWRRMVELALNGLRISVNAR
jgi:AcrR family transcriptional regulator